MDPEIGKVVVIAITTVGAVAWLAGLFAMLRAERDWRESSSLASERFELEGDRSPGTIVGEAEVEGHPEELSAKLTGLLAREGMGPLGPVKILSSDRDEVAFEPAGPSPLGFRGGRIRLTPAGSRTRIDYALRAGSRGYLIGGWVALALGLAALVAAPTLAFTIVLPSPNPSIRGQCFHVFQMVHFLWPPFLFAHLSRQPARLFRGRIEGLIHNLPYT
jgi:hypothetical protein